MKKIKNLLISFVCLFGLVNPNIKKVDNNELSIVFDNSINDELTKQNLSSSMSSIYDKVANGVVTVLNYEQNEGEEKFSSFGSAFAYYEDSGFNPYIYFISNNHVVDEASSIYLVTNYNQRVKGEVIGVDKIQDCSVIRVRKSLFTEEIPILDLYRDEQNNLIDPEVGDYVMVVGTPASYTFRNTLTVGLVSGVQRIVVKDNNDIFDQDHAIQLCCAVNPGNSGGPVFNEEGKVIGVSTLKLKIDGSYSIDSLNFCLPIVDMYKVAENIRTTYNKKLSKVNINTRVSLSSKTKYISIRDLSLEKRILYGVEGLNKGVMLLSNDTELNLNRYSVITQIDDFYTDNVVLLRRYLFNATSGSNVKVKVYKNNDCVLDEELSEIDVTLKTLTLTSSTYTD